MSPSGLFFMLEAPRVIPPALRVFDHPWDIHPPLLHGHMGTSLTVDACRETNVDSNKRLINLNTDLSRNADREQNHFEDQRKGLLAIDEKTTNLKESSAETRRQFGDLLVNLEKEVGGISEMSSQQTRDIRTLLQAIKGQLSPIAASHEVAEQLPTRTSQPARSDQSATHMGPDSDKTSELLESIARLCELAQAKEGIRDDEKAATVIDDLVALLEFAAENSEDPRHPSHSSRKRSIDSVSELDRRDLKRIRGFLTSSDCVSINRQGELFGSIVSLK